MKEEKREEERSGIEASSTAETYRFVPSPPGGETLQLSKVTEARETEGAPLIMRATAPPFGAVQAVNDVAGVEEAISKESPVESDAWTAAPKVVVHLTNENVQLVSDVLVCSFVSEEMIINGEDNSICVCVAGEIDTEERERLPA